MNIIYMNFQKGGMTMNLVCQAGKYVLLLYPLKEIMCY